jgi:enterochelin esterase-like enzyme
MMPRLPITAALLAALLGAAPAAAQVATTKAASAVNAPVTTVERITVHSPAIAGNLEGNSPDRPVLVILPPGYRAHPGRRYPVVYALHGYTIGAEQWIREIRAPQTIEAAYAQGARPMIVVIPDTKTVHNGSFYSSSETVGDFETFITRDLVGYIDGHYRTIPDRRARGLTGHSMGGYGTARIGMKHPEVFGALYMMSPCCLSTTTMSQPDAATERTLRALRSPADGAALGWGPRAVLATAAAWSPNPKAPPLYLDLPSKDGVVQADVMARWTANTPLAMVDQYVGNLRRYAAIGLDVGDRDGLKGDAEKLRDALGRYNIPTAFEVYPGDHVSGVAGRVQDRMIPFFARNLMFK